MSREAVNLVSRVRLRLAAKAVLNQLAWFANAHGEEIFPSVGTLAERASLSRRAVQKILRELEQLGAIQGSGWRLGGRHRTTHYKLVQAWIQTNCEAQKGERDDTKRANGSAGKGERDSPEQKEHEYKQKEEPISHMGKEPQATPYEQQLRKQQYRKAMRGKSFPEPLSGERLHARKREARNQLEEFARKRDAES